MTRPILAAILALTLTGCRVVHDNASVRTLMYWPHVDGAPVTAEGGPF